MYFEARTHKLVPVADAAEAATKIKAGNIHDYEVPTWDHEGATYHAVSDGHGFGEVAILRREGEMLHKMDSITVAWIKTPQGVVELFEAAQSNDVNQFLGEVSTFIVGKPKGHEVAWFECGCCGESFEGNVAHQLTFDQDAGYGRCPDCE